MINIAIVDDELIVLKKMQEYIEKYAILKGLTVKVTCFSNSIDFVSDYRSEYDVVFLDIEMPLFDGMQTARKLRQTDENVVIVFVTHMASYALNGFEVGASDFIVKPFNYDAFAVHLSKLFTLAQTRKSSKLIVNTENAVKCVSTDDILYIEVIGHSVVYHTFTEEFTAYDKLSDLEEKYKKYFFIRCHKSFLVNLRNVTEVKGGNIFLGKQTIPLARSIKKEFLQQLTDYIGGIA